jgi:hypothetical protein
MHVSLTYVYRCDPRLVHAIYVGPGHGLLQRHGLLTLGEIQDPLLEKQLPAAHQYLLPVAHVSALWVPRHW